MSKAELKALADALPADTLYSRQNVGKHLPGVTDLPAAIAFCVEQGWWCIRSQFGIEEFWKDGQPHMRATITSAPRKPPPTVTAPAITKPPRRVAEKPKTAPAPLTGGLFG